MMREHKIVRMPRILLVAPLYVFAFSFLCLISVGANIELDFLHFIGLLCLIVLSGMLILRNKVKNLGILCLVVTIVYAVIHPVLVWMFISPYKLPDARIFFIDRIVEYGKIESLDIYTQSEGIYYTAYPSIWIIASFIKLICSFSSFNALALSHLVTYLCLILFIYAFRKFIVNEGKISEGELKRLDVSPLFMIILTSYVVQNLQLLTSANTLGILGLTFLIVALRIFLMQSEQSKGYKMALLLLITCIPLLTSSPVPLFTGYFIFFLLILNLFVIKPNGKKFFGIIRKFILLFVGTWLYFSIILPVFQIGGTYHFLVLLTEFLNEPNLVRPSEGQAIHEQMLHFVYPYSGIVTPLYYLLPLVIGFTSSFLLFINKMINLCKIKRSISWKNLTLEVIFYMTVIQVQLLYIAAIFIFGYKGMENALARYAYLYLTPLNTIVTLKLIYSYTKTLISNPSRPLAMLITLPLILIFQIINLEAFYAPFFSLMRIPDLYQLKCVFP